MFEKLGIKNANSLSVPAKGGLSLRKSEVDKKECISYREAIGSLLFTARTCRPDIEYLVNYVSQFLYSFTKEHWQTVKRIFRYLIGTRNYGLVFGNSGSTLNLIGFTDADYTGCIQTRKSRSSCVFLLNGGPVSWSSKHQDVVSLLTAEGEYIALANGTKEAYVRC